MIRLARRALLLVVVYVLTSAATTYAECARVLWERREVISPPRLASRRSSGNGSR